MKLIHKHIVNAVPLSAVKEFEINNPWDFMRIASLDRNYRARSLLTRSTIGLMRAQSPHEFRGIPLNIINGVRFR